MKRALLFVALTALGACGSARGPSGPTCAAGPRAPAGATAPERAEIELVESAPLETSLDHADVRDAADVWPEMIDRAKRTLDLAQFYASDADGDAAGASRLAPVVAAVERAVLRGVRVRFLADAGFAPKYPETLERLRRADVAVKTIDCAPRYGGVQHAKYFVVDAEESFVGSQNFDWRALAHIQEMGVRVRSSAIARALLDVFETDWALADAGAPSTTRARPNRRGVTARAASGEALSVVASPKGWLPDETGWDLDRLVALLDGAATSVDVQVLHYSTENRDESAFPTLDDALRRAAARGVRVRLLVSHWGAKAGSHARRSIEELSAAPNVEVRVLTIPPWSGGEIPFARVAHAKYMVVDGRAAWIGTSNWEGDYFLKTRNVAIVAEGGALPPRLARVFDDGWSSAYAAPLTAPR
ncbi:MAG: hypothetical protein KF782_14205 [Labilithrix sp.]|nr:hypothetical protein [Labilithrix sp.]